MTFRDLEKQLDKLGDSTTPFLANKTAEQEIDFNIDPSKGLTMKKYIWYSNNSLFDSTHFTEISGGIDIETSTTSSDTALIHSAVPGQYRSQTLAVPGLGAVIDSSDVSTDSNNLVSMNHGLVAIGSGWHDASSGGWDVNGSSGTIQTFLGFKIDTNGAEAVLVSNGQHQDNSPVSQENWNIDVMDGSSNNDNPSGRTFNPDDGYIYNFPYTWYNQGALIVGLLDNVQNKFIPVHKFSVDGEPSTDRPNKPTMLLVDNNGDSNKVKATLGGMQYSRYGAGAVKTTRTTPVSRVTTGGTIGTSKSTDSNNAIDPDAEPGQPLVAIRNKNGKTGDTVLRVPKIVIEADNDVYLYQFDEYDDSSALTNENFRTPTAVDSAETKAEVDTSASDYSPSTSVFRGWTKVVTDKKNKAVLGIESTNDKIPIGATRVITAVHDGTSTDANPIKVDLEEGF